MDFRAAQTEIVNLLNERIASEEAKAKAIGEIQQLIVTEKERLDTEAIEAIDAGVDAARNLSSRLEAFEKVERFEVDVMSWSKWFEQTSETLNQPIIVAEQTLNKNLTPDQIQRIRLLIEKTMKRDLGRSFRDLINNSMELGTTLNTATDSIAPQMAAFVGTVEEKKSLLKKLKSSIDSFVKGAEDQVEQDLSANGERLEELIEQAEESFSGAVGNVEEVFGKLEELAEKVGDVMSELSDIRVALEDALESTNSGVSTTTEATESVNQVMATVA